MNISHRNGLLVAISAVCVCAAYLAVHWYGASPSPPSPHPVSCAGERVLVVKRGGTLLPLLLSKGAKATGPAGREALRLSYHLHQASSVDALLKAGARP